MKEHDLIGEFYSAGEPASAFGPTAKVWSELAVRRAIMCALRSKVEQQSDNSASAPCGQCVHSRGRYCLLSVNHCIHAAEDMFTQRT